MRTGVNTAMKFRTFTRHIREGLKNIFRNGWMSVASIGAVTITLFLVAAFLTVILNLNQVAQNIEEDVEINVLIDRIAKEEDIEKLATEIEKLKEVEGVSFVSKDDRLKEIIEGFGEHGESMKMVEQDNPLNHEFRVRAGDPRDTNKISDSIKKLEHVDDVVYNKDTTDKLFEFNTYARIVGIVLIAGLLFTAIFLISNTIKLTIMARSSEIGIMKLVGATNGFIRWPFFMEGLFIGALGSILPISTILIGYRFINFDLLKQYIPFFELLPYNPFAFQLSGLILGLGIIIGIWGSVMSIRKFLKV